MALGTVVVLRAEDGRSVVLALTLAAVVAPLAGEPLPHLAALGFRIVAALLAGYLLRIAVRNSTALVGPTRLGGSVEASFVGVAFALGLLLSPPAGGPAGSQSAAAAALSAGVGALNLLLFSHDALRAGAGAVLGLIAAGLATTWLSGSPGDVFELALAAAILAAAAATAWLCAVTYAVRGDLQLSTRPRDLRDVG